MRNSGTCLKPAAARAPQACAVQPPQQVPICAGGAGMVSEICFLVTIQLMHKLSFKRLINNGPKKPILTWIGVKIRSLART